MGKSSILLQIEQHDRVPDCIPVYIDCPGLGEVSEQSLFYKIARRIGRQLKKSGYEVKIPRSSDFSPDDSFYEFTELLEGYSDIIGDSKILLMFNNFC